MVIRRDIRFAAIGAMLLSALAGAGGGAQVQPGAGRTNGATRSVGTKMLAQAVDVEKLEVVRTILEPARSAAKVMRSGPVSAPTRTLLTRGPESTLSCDVLVVGGGTGGVAAAEALARNKMSVIVTEPTSQLGGQFSSQAVACPDENRFIETSPGCGTKAYRELRTALRAKYAAMPGILPGKSKNVGDCWVSRVSGEPLKWQEVILNRLKQPQVAGGVKQPQVAGGVKQILRRHQLVRVTRSSSGRFESADFVNLDTAVMTRVTAKYMLDATETGEGLMYAECPWTVGAESKATYNEKYAPEAAHSDWVQSFTYCFALRYKPNVPGNVIPKPEEYDYFKSLGRYTMDLSSPDTQVIYKVFANSKAVSRKSAKTAPLRSFWSYRRLVAGASFKGKKSPDQDVAMINWIGNDFQDETMTDKPLKDQIRVLKRAKAFALGFLYWLQTECPRDNGAGVGYPELQLAMDIMGSTDGLSIAPYVRESRRLVPQFALTENHMDVKPGAQWAVEFPDTVGTGYYGMDIHPSKNEPGTWADTLPYHLPLGAFIGKGGPPNVIPAAKNIGGSRLALASVRMHPTEWLCGEVAGHLAAFCIKNQVDPAAVRAKKTLLTAFQQQLTTAGVPIRWSKIIPKTRGEEEDFVMTEYRLNFRE